MLTWEPPTNWETFTEHPLPDAAYVETSSPWNVNLPVGQDTCITHTDVVRRPLVIRGGGNVVWMGGEVEITAGDDTIPGTHRRALGLSELGGEPAGRIIHIEGLKIHGDTLAEGIDCMVPTAVVQLQNIWIDTVKLLSDSDVDHSHPDILQAVGGGWQELRIDSLEGKTGYQGWYLGDGHGPIYARRVQTVGVETIDTAGNPHPAHRLLSWDSRDAAPIFIEDFWISHHPNGAWVDCSNTNQGSGLAKITDVVVAIDQCSNPDYMPTDTESVVTFPDTAICQLSGERFCNNFAGTAAGQICSGLSPTIFVWANEVGIGYESPGYGPASVPKTYDVDLLIAGCVPVTGTITERG